MLIEHGVIYVFPPRDTGMYAAANNLPMQVEFGGPKSFWGRSRAIVNEAKEHLYVTRRSYVQLPDGSLVPKEDYSPTPGCM